MQHGMTSSPGQASLCLGQNTGKWVFSLLLFPCKYAVDFWPERRCAMTEWLNGECVVLAHIRSLAHGQAVLLIAFGWLLLLLFCLILTCTCRLLLSMNMKTKQWSSSSRTGSVRPWAEASLDLISHRKWSYLQSDEYGLRLWKARFHVEIWNKFVETNDQICRKRQRITNNK